MLLACFVCFLSALRGHKLLATCSFQYCTTPGDDSAHVFCSEILYLTLDESVKASIDTFDIKEVIDASTCDGTYSCIHAGSISSRCQDTDCFNSAHNAEMKIEVR